MATTLVQSSLSLASECKVLAPSNTHDMSAHHMPNVLIVPPEEELAVNPPWTYFDARTDAKADPSTSPDIEALDVKLGIFQQTANRSPAFHRTMSNESADTVIMPKKSSESEMDASDDPKQERVIGEDIIEVVKVRRNEGMADVTEAKDSGLKKSKTFRARASEAFKTIGRVASKGSRKSSFSSSNSGEPWPSQDDAQHPEEAMEAGVLPRPSTPNMTRRKSMQLSQLFSSTRKRTSSTVTTDTTGTANSGPSRPEVPESPASSDFSIISTPTEESLPTPASSLSDRTNHNLHAQTPTLNKRRSFVEKISVLDLQRLFTPSGTRPIIQESESAPIGCTTRRDSLPLPPSLPQLPHIRASADAFTSESSIQRPHSFHVADRYSLSSLPSTTASSKVAFRSQENIPEETSFEAELRLDSLHFDSLHFDPDEFKLNF
ncbi:hypothetical protein BXZ70DRAFT_280225 [Cristinia sonorae]|uniref:Uncharacterized protein n=1 Tax=Cristinia sonorae TaxID=1940300 RepID=A0A8K0UXL7_9AGAR|nr:hypothetical protein BXZ70DRAFT_280225 [Cristinia sonorae]